MATYKDQCSAVGGFGYASNFSLYVELNNQNTDINNNKSQVAYNVYCKSSGSGAINAKHKRYFSLNGKEIINTTESISASSPYAYIPIASGTIDVTHNSDGTKVIPFSAEIQATSYGVSASISGNFTLNTIARSSSISCSTANIEENAVITITSASNNFTHDVVANFGNLKVNIVSKVKAGTFQWKVPADFYSQIPSAKTGWGTIECTTFNGQTQIGSVSTRFDVTTSESKCKPSLSAVVVDTNSTTIALSGNKNKLIKHKSTAKVTITTSAKNNATISKKTVNGTSVTGSELSISNVFATVFKIEVTDSRGYTNSVELKPTIVNYEQLSINTNFYRPQPTTGEVSLSFSGKCFNSSFGSVSNTLSITWKYKKSTATSWTNGGTITPTLNGNTITSKTISLGKTFDYQTAYDFQLVAADKLTTLTINSKVSEGLPIFAWGKNIIKFFAKTILKKSSGDTGYYAKRTDTGTEVWFGVGSGGVNHGVYSTKLGKWIVYADTNNAYLNGTANKALESNKLENINGRIANANVTHTYENSKAHVQLLQATGSMTANKPVSDGYILHFSWDNSGTYNAQFFIGNSNGTGGRLQARGCNGANGTWGSWETILRNKTLYDNSSGTTGTITLSESAANFHYFEIFFLRADNDYGSARIANPNRTNS